MSLVDEAIANAGSDGTAANVPEVIVHARPEKFADDPGAPAPTREDGTPLTRSAWERTCCDARWTRLLVDAINQTLDYGRSTRDWPRALRKFTGCGAAADGGPPREATVPTSAYVPPVGEVRDSRADDEFGAKRELVVRVPGTTGRPAMLALAAATAKAGDWRSVACITLYERCFENADWFVAMVARADLVHEDAPTWSGAKATPTDEVLVVIERVHRQQ